MLRFSLKESLYKAMHPLICQYIGFQEVEVQPVESGTARVHFQLKSGAHRGLQNVTAHWRRVGPYFLSTSSVRLVSSPAGRRSACLVE
jgi:4'-phosphopantetheinyl transferase EntD